MLTSLYYTVSSLWCGDDERGEGPPPAEEGGGRPSPNICALFEYVVRVFDGRAAAAVRELVGAFCGGTSQILRGRIGPAPYGSLI